MVTIHPTCKHLFENLPVAVYTTDKEGYINYYNNAAIELWDKAPELGKERWVCWSKMFMADGMKPITPENSPIARFLKNGKEGHGIELYIETEKGSKKYVLPHPNYLIDQSGEIIGGVNLIIDITEKRTIEDTKARFEAIVQDSSDGIISKTLDGIVTSWNKSAERIFSYTEKEMIGQHISKLIPPDRWEEESFILNQIRSGKRVDTFETKRLTKFGDLLDISLTISPIRNERGIIIGASKIVRDITKQKALQKKIEDSELLFKTITNTSPAALWLTNDKGRTVFFSDTWLKWTGHSFEDQVNDGWLNLIEEEDQQKVKGHFRHCFERLEDYDAEFRMKSVDGTIHWYRTEGKPYHDLNNCFSGYAGSITDITDMKEIQKRKDDFIIMASHELKTPITSIYGYIQLLVNIFEEKDKERLELSTPVVRSSLGTVERQVNRLTRLISELLDLSRLQTGKMEFKNTSFNILKLVEEVIEEARLISSRHKILLESEYEGNFEGDRDRLEQVLTNLLSNAIKYSGDDSSIIVSLKEENDELLISVCDEGIGIPKKDQARIFERFYRGGGKVEETYPGFGIGLYIANEIVNSHGGSIKVNSRKGKGTIFTVHLPVPAYKA